VKIFNTSLNLIGKEESLRGDFNFQLLVKVQAENPEKYYSFEDLFEIRKNKIDYSNIEGKFNYCQIGDVDADGFSNPVELDFEIREIINESYYKKIENGDIMKANKDDILFSFLIPYDFNNTGKFLRITKLEEDIYYSTAFIDIIPKICPEVMYYSLKTVFYNNLVSIARIGKGYTGYAIISEDDLYKLKFSKKKIDNIKTNEAKVTDKIIQYELEINSTKESVLKQEYIINEIFSKYFEYDKNLIYKVHKGMTYGTQRDGNTKMSNFYVKLSSINDTKVRLSVRSNNPIVNEVYEILDKIGNKKIKDIIIENVHRGKSPQYDENGMIPVIKTAHVTNNGINQEFTEFVSEKFYDKKIDSQMNIGDILLTSTGKPSIGKIAIYDSDDKAIPDGHISIIRIDQSKYSAEFLVYFIRSILGYVQLEKEFVGCTNQIELYSDSIENLVIPDISLEKQEKIVAEIRKKINKQSLLEEKIKKLKKQIDDLIKDVAS